MSTRSIGLWWAASLMFVSVADAAEPPPRVPSATHVAVLDAYRSAHIRAYLGNDPQPLTAHQADSLRLAPAYQKTVMGKANAAVYHRAFLQRFKVSAYTRQPIEAVDLGSRVMESGRFTMTVALPGDATLHMLAGKYMDIWQKADGGRLLLETAAWNHDRLPAIAEQLRFAEVPAVHTALGARVPVRAGVSLELAAWARLLEAAITQHDAKTWALLYTDDAMQLANHGDVVSGRAALEGYFVEHVKAMPVFEKLDLRTERIDDLGRYVVEYAAGVVHWRMNEHSGVNLGKNIQIWRRGDDGALRIWRAISMYD
jgi:ketosteroid isomerase-like protein